MNKEQKGEIAMEMIAGHPLYASTSGITYDEAIKVAKAIFGPDFVEVKKEDDRIKGLSFEELRAELKQGAL